MVPLHPVLRLGGIAVCNANNTKENPFISQDGQSGVVIIWVDSTFNNPTNGDIHAHHLSAAGVRQWAAYEIQIATHEGRVQRDHMAVTEKNNSFLVA
jgi:hypothetical protein